MTGKLWTLGLFAVVVAGCSEPTSASSPDAGTVARAAPLWLRDVPSAQREAGPSFAFTEEGGRATARTGALAAAIDRDTLRFEVGSTHAALRLVQVGDRAPSTVVARTVEGNWIELRRTGLTEWYVNGPSGLEQGFVVDAPPGGGSELVLGFEVKGLRPEAVDGAAALVGEQASIFVNGLVTRDADDAPVPSRFEVEGDRLRFRMDASRARYPLRVDPLYSIAARGQPAAASSSFTPLPSIAISGTRTLLGAQTPYLGVFTRQANGTLTETALPLRDSAGAIHFGKAVAIDGTTAFASRYSFGTQSHYSVEPYSLGGSAWVRGTPIYRPGIANSDTLSAEFGTALRAKNRRLLIGAPGIVNYPAGREDGEVFLYSYDVGQAPAYINKFNLVDSSATQGAQLGTSVDFEDGVTPFTVIAGAPGYGGIGRVFQIRFPTSGGPSSPYSFAPVGGDAVSGMRFGAAVTIAMNVVAIGAPNAPAGGNAGAGNVFVYRRADPDAAWTLFRKLEPPTPGANLGFGTSVAIRGPLLAVGAPALNNASPGAVHLYRIGATDVTFERTLAPPVTPLPAGFDFFGHGVAIDTDLAVGAWANDRPNAFVFRRGLGEWCSVDADCASGFCTEGVCCNARCNEGCRSCVATNTGGADGTCANVRESTDPKNACSGGFCSAGACQAKKANGATCRAATECASGICNPEGVCCDRACTAPCESCRAATKGSGADGVCGGIAAGVAPRVTNGCTKGASYPLDCSADGLCDGTGRCRTVAPSGVSCAPSGGNTCTNGTTNGQVCDGTNAVCAVRTTSCGAYACNAAGTACNTRCTSNADCKSGFRCNTEVSACIELSGNGTSCAGDGECASGHCVDGVCCNDGCQGQCQACNEPGALGRCQPVNGAPRGSRRACDGEAGTCAGYCNGAQTDACFYPPSTTSCAESCTNGTATRSTCDGKGKCVALAPTDCPTGGACDGDTCRIGACSEPRHCRSGFTCKDGTCVQAGTATCSNDLRESISTVDGSRVACAPYLCDPTRGTCRETCSVTDDCAAEAACDAARRVCTPRATEDEGGCSYGRRTSDVSLWIVSLAAAMALARRRRSA
jgi:hypothetical protein